MQLKGIPPYCRIDSYLYERFHVLYSSSIALINNDLAIQPRFATTNSDAQRYIVSNGYKKIVYKALKLQHLL